MIIQVTDPWHPVYKSLLREAALAGHATPTFRQQQVQNGLMDRLSIDGQLPLLDVVRIYANNGGQDFARFNFIDPTLYKASLINTPTFVSNQGFSNGGVGYIDHNWIPSSNGVRFTQNSASMGGYVYTGASSSSLIAIMGIFDGTNNLLLYDQGTIGASLLAGRVNAGTADLTLTGSSDFASSTMYSIKRTADSGAGAVTAYVNGGSVNTASTASTGLPTLSLQTLQRNATTTPLGVPTTLRMAIDFVGSGSLDHAKLYTAFNWYMSNL